MSVADDLVQSGHRTRSILVWGGCLFSIAALAIACWLIFKGAKGEFSILSEYKGWKLYMTSMAPGLLFLVAGTIVMTAAIRKKVHLHTNHGDGNGHTTVDI